MIKRKLLMTFVLAGALGIELPACAQPDAMDQKVDKQMNRIVRALERNKKSAEVLIQAARNAGADSAAVSNLEQMSTAFREAFMATVSPQQIVESIIGAPEVPDGTQGIIITGPDGSTWLVTPSDQNPLAAPPPPGCPAGPWTTKKQAPTQPGMPQFMPPQPGMVVPPPPPPGVQPGMPQNRPPQFISPQPGLQTPPPPPPGATPQAGQPAVQGEMIILEDVPQYMPLWPTKEDLGKDGVLKYLERRDARVHAN